MKEVCMMKWGHVVIFIVIIIGGLMLVSIGPPHEETKQLNGYFLFSVNNGIEDSNTWVAESNKAIFPNISKLLMSRIKLIVAILTLSLSTILLYLTQTGDGLLSQKIRR